MNILKNDYAPNVMGIQKNDCTSNAMSIYKKCLYSECGGHSKMLIPQTQ